MPFDTSSLAPYQPPGPASSPQVPGSGFDLSSLAPMDSSSSSAPSSSQSTLGGMAAQIPAGLDQFAYDVMGLPVAIGRTIGNAITQPTRDAQAAAVADGKPGGTGFAIPEIPDDTIGSPKWLAHQFNQHVGTTDPADIPANGGWEQAVRIGANVAAQAAVPETVFSKAGELIGAGAEAGANIGRMLGAGNTPASVARNTVVGGTAAMAGQGATNLPVPEWAKPVVATGAALATGLGAEGAITGAERAAQAAGRYAAPFTQAGREAAVGEKIQNAASDPAAVRSALASGPDEIVPGSMPTTFQQSDDMGLGSLERSVASQNPERFMQRRADQNAARLSALNDVQAEGHPEAVSDYFRSQLADIDAQTQAAYDAAHQGAQGQLAGLGGGRTPEAYGADIQGAINPQLEAATGQARTALDDLGGTQGAAAIGDQARTALQSQLDASKAAERRLWGAVDPDGTLNVLTSPLKRATQAIYGEMGPEQALTLSAAEKSIPGIIGEYGSTLPFSRLTQLRSVISQAMRDAKSPLQPNDVAYGRLSQLRGAVEDAISDTVEGKVAQEQQAVASGALAPEDTLSANLLKQVEDWRAGREAQAATGTVGAQGVADSGSAGPTARTSVPGAASQAGLGSAGAARTVGLSPDAGSGPLVDQQAADRLTAATAATKERKQTFGAKPVASILKRPGESYPYNAPSAYVAAQLWKPGPQGATSINSILKAAKNSPDAIEAIRSAAVSSLRSKAPEGILTPEILGRWRAQHADALNALEAASPGTIGRLDQAAQASRALDRFSGYNPQASASTLPERYFAKGDAGFQTVNDLRNLVGQDRADTILSDYAADSLRKSALGPDGNIDPKKFEAWRKAHSGALRAMPGLSACMDDAAGAATHLENVARVRREELDGYQKTAAGKLLNVSDPADVTKTVGGMFGRKDSVKLFRDLATESKGDPEALAGLRKAVVDHMQSKLVSNTEAGTSGQNLLKTDAFQKFLGDNLPALRQLFSEEELGQWQAIARDLKRANRSVVAVKLPGQSNTAQDFAAMGKHGGERPTVLRILGHALGYAGHAVFPVAGGLAGGIPGLLAGFGADYAMRAVEGARSAGISKMDELLTEAMLNPDVARALLAKAPKRPDAAAGTLARALRATAITAPAITGQRQ